MTTQAKTLPLARIGSDAAEPPVSSAPALILVSDTSAQRAKSPWLTLLSSGLVVGASLFAAPALSISLTGKAATDASLQISPLYRALAPICDTLDAISLFSQGQHFAFLITSAVGFATWRLLRRRHTATPIGVRAELGAAIKALIALVGVYIGGAMLPRPIARLAMLSPDAVVIDFHSHTRYSWDGSSAFSPEQSRRWHRASGFDVAYVTDHSSFAGAEEAALENPARAGEATVMLSGIEVRDRGNHLVVLGTDARDWQSYTAGDLHERIFERQAESRGSARPVVLFTLPGNLKSESAVAVDGIELSDAAPRGLSQSDAEREQIVARALMQKTSLVASSNNHGWASASPAWSVMQIHDWRAMTPTQLDVAIREKILRQGMSAVQIIDRRAPGPVSFVGLSLTVPATAWRMLQTMSWPERISWLIWIWVAYASVLLGRSRGRQTPEAQQQSKVGDFTRWRHVAPMP